MAVVSLSTGPSATADAQEQNAPTVGAVVSTAPVFNYEDAPGTPDGDDPAIWVNQSHPRSSLVIATAKDAGLLVYDLDGRLVQALRPPNSPRILAADPATPAGVNAAADRPCPGSTSGETFGRFNNVDIAYGIRLGGRQRADVAVLSDRGCDRVRFYRIDPDDPAGPLVDITAPDVPRVFPRRYEQPSFLQPSGAVEGWRDNPVDDQNTVYGLTVSQADGRTVFVTSRERGLVRQLRIEPAGEGRLTYETERTWLFETTFALRNEDGQRYRWTPCREAALEEPQSEGVVFDAENRTLFVAFETIGLYKLPLGRSDRDLARVGVDSLIEPVTTFGRAYHATPDEDEFECDYDADEAPAADTIVASGSAFNAGRVLQADLEGLTILASDPGRTWLLASSQGDSSFHLYAVRPRSLSRLGTFFVDGVAETDGIHVVTTPLGRQYPFGLLVVQNGDAPEPDDTGDVNGYEFDGATQFKFVDLRDALRALATRIEF